jgi:DNA-binding transcriptional MerR regulator
MMGERQQFTLDELAAATGMTPRNVRAYQTRGLISPPDRQGRRSIYRNRHLRQLLAVRRARAEGATLNLISGVLTDGRRLSIPPSGQIARSETVPGTVRRRADLRRALTRLDVPEESIVRIIDDLVEIRAATSTGIRTVVTADVIARATQAQRLGVAPEQALEVSVLAATAVRPLTDRIRDVLPDGSEHGPGHTVIELVAGLVGAVVRDNLIAELSASVRDEDGSVDVTDRAMAGKARGQSLETGSANGHEEFEFDGGVQR